MDKQYKVWLYMSKLIVKFSYLFKIRAKYFGRCNSHDPSIQLSAVLYNEKNE